MKQILVVEDDNAISLVLKAYLDKEGYSVRQAYNLSRGDNCPPITST